MKSDIETEKAFSVLRFVRNYGDRSSVVEEIYCDILQLQTIQEAVIILDAKIVLVVLKEDCVGESRLRGEDSLCILLKKDMLFRQSVGINLLRS